MKITLFMAMSLNGKIAGENGNEDFLSHENWKQLIKLSREIGFIVIGRRTYEEVRGWEDYSFDDLDCKKIIISSNINYNLPEGYLLANSPKEAINLAVSLGFKEILLTGGGELNGAFAKEKIIDEIIIDIEPALVRRGVNLFGNVDFELRLRFIESKIIEGDIIQLRYQVKR